LAHADIVVRITALDLEIAAEPGNPNLYLRRGELHRHHRDWLAAVSDYQRAARLAPDLPELDFYTGRLWLEAGAPSLARAPLNRFLAARPDHANGLVTRARVLAAVGDRPAAVADFDRAIALLDSPSPDLYLERARLIAAQGPDHVDLALEGIDEGFARLGPLVTLARFAIEQERARGRFPAALERLERLPAKVIRIPTWQALRGDLLSEMGRVAAAREAYAAGLEAIEALPVSRRESRAIITLESRLKQAIGPKEAEP
jgi:tetratricopeptide (TPR) repeat protein